MLKDFINRIRSWVKPAAYISGIGDLFGLWQKSDARGRGILVLCFAPMFACIAGILFTVVSFVLFVLPSFVLKFLGWLLLTAMFSAGGKYCYERMTGQTSPRFASDEPFSSASGEASYTDVKYTEDKPAGDEIKNEDTIRDEETVKKEDWGRKEKEESGPATRRTIYRRTRSSADMKGE